VLCVDNLSLGSLRHIEDFRNSAGFEFAKWDVSRPDWHAPLRGRTFDLLAHLAANSDISLGASGRKWNDPKLGHDVRGAKGRGR